MFGLGIAACVSIGASEAMAASAVKAIMKAWKADANVALTMSNGASDYNDAEMRRILEGFITDAQGIGARIASPSGADIKHRFAQFAADAQAASAVIGKKPQARAALLQVVNDCKACHDVYAN